MRITLLQKRGSVPAEDFSRTLDQRISALIGDLSASCRLRGFTKSGWTELEISGRDEEVVSEILIRELHLAPQEFSKITLGDDIYGVIEEKPKDSVVVDVGIERPAICKVRIPLNELRAQLADGQPLTISEIAELYCIRSGMRFGIRISHVDHEGRSMEGCVSDAQMEILNEWIRLGLDRIIASNCTHEQAQSAVRKLRLERDIIEVEPIMLVEQSFLCKLGTDAVGLIPKLGRILRFTELYPFVPKKIRGRCKQWL